MHKRTVLKAAVVAIVFAGMSSAQADEVKALFPAAMRNVVTALLPGFEKISGHTVQIQYGTVGAIVDRLNKGEGADLAVVTPGPLSKLVSQGLVEAEGQAVVASVGISVFVRRGDPRPDVTTADGLKKALLSSKAIVYGDPKLGDSSGIAAAEIIEKLGLTAATKSKTKLVPATAKGETVATGGADIGFDQRSNVVVDPRIEALADLPPEFRQHTKYTAGIVKNAAHRDAGKALIEFLRSPAAQELMRGKGFEQL